MKRLFSILAFMFGVFSGANVYAERIVGKIGDGSVSYASDMLVPLIFLSMILLGTAMKMVFFDNNKEDGIAFLFSIVILIMVILIFNIV